MSPIRRANDADLNLLLALDALLAEGNVTRAAKRVGLSQPATAPGGEMGSMAPPADVLARWESGEVDVYLGAPQNLPPQYRRQVLIETEYRLLAREGHPALSGKLTLEKLAKLPHIRLGFRG